MFDTQVHACILLQQALIAQNQLETALEVSERGRARAFVDLLSHRVSPEAVNRSVVAPSIEQIKQIANEQNATLVQYSMQPSNLYIWVIKPTGDIAFRSVDLTACNVWRMLL